MLKTAILIPLLLIAVIANAGKYLLPNESPIYQFTTTNGKKMMFAEDTGKKYLVYRFGTKDKIELEYISKATDSQKKFIYSSYFRAVTQGMYGLDQKFVAFYIANMRYVVYDVYHEPSTEDGGTNERKVGITVTDTTTQKKVNIKANLKTIKGSIGYMWDDPRFRPGDGLYEEE